MICKILKIGSIYNYISCGVVVLGGGYCAYCDAQPR